MIASLRVPWWILTELIQHFFIHNIRTGSMTGKHFPKLAFLFFSLVQFQSCREELWPLSKRLSECISDKIHPMFLYTCWECTPPLSAWNNYAMQDLLSSMNDFIIFGFIAILSYSYAQLKRQWSTVSENIKRHVAFHLPIKLGSFCLYTGT